MTDTAGEQTVIVTGKTDPGSELILAHSGAATTTVYADPRGNWEAIVVGDEDPAPSVHIESQRSDTPITIPVAFIGTNQATTFVRIPAGAYFSGVGMDDVDDARIHQDFWLQRTEVTNAQYRACVDDTNTEHTCPPPANDMWHRPEYAEYPVTNVSPDDAWTYARWFTNKTGVTASLPSAREWEMAACGTDMQLYPWGDTLPDESRLNFNNHQGGPMKVGSFPLGASPTGLLDMAGNVREWTSTVTREGFSYAHARGSSYSTPLYGWGSRPIPGYRVLCAYDRGRAYNAADAISGAQKIPLFANEHTASDDIGFRLKISPNGP